MDERQREIDPSLALRARGAQGGGDARSSEGPTRRTVLGRGSKILVYATPLVQMVRPKQALAAYGVYS